MINENYIEKGGRKIEMPTIIEFILLIVTVIFCMLFGQLLNFAWAAIAGIDLANLAEIRVDNTTYEKRNFLRLIAATSNAFSFIVSAIVFSVFMYKKNWLAKLQLKSPFKSEWVPMMLVFVFAGFFFSQFTFWLNQMLPLPEWANSMEDQAGDLIASIVTMESSVEFLLTLITVAVIPAVGEELIFRGILQRKLEEITQKPHLAILIAALIFSFIHFQFAGFLPRVVLGLLLGYLFYWTRNLWVPILAHFVINGFQVVASYLAKDKIADLKVDEIENLPASQMLITAAVSLIFIYLAGNWFHQRRERSIEEKFTLP